MNKKSINSGESNSTRFKALMKASLIAIGVDIFLILLKYLLARLTGSAVLLADALHSGGDLAVSLTVLVSILVNYSFKNNKWAKHAEVIVALLISVLLIIGSFQLLLNAIQNLPSSFVLKPNIPLIIAFLGISLICGITLAMSRFKRQIGEKYKSVAFIAEGIHTYSDFFTSFGVWCTLLLGYFGVHIERVMTLIIGVIVLSIGVKLFIKALQSITPYQLLSSFVKKITPSNISEKVQKAGQIFGKLKLDVAKINFVREDWIMQHKRLIILLNLFLVVLLYVGTGFYTVLPYQTGVELLFGKVVELNPPGLHVHAPTPFGRVVLVDTEVTARVESGFRTNWDYEGKEPKAYLWEFTHAEGRYTKIINEALAITGDENIFDGNFLCYYRITDPVQFALNNKNAREILRSLFCCEIHATIGHYELDSLLTSARGKVQTELTQNMREAVQALPIGVEILKVYMQDVHPPINVVPQYRAVASAREKKDEIIHRASAYANDLLPRSRGNAEANILQANAYLAEKTLVAKGESESFLTKQRNFHQYQSDQQIRLWWETVEKVIANKSIYILPKNAKRRIYTSEVEQKKAYRKMEDYKK